MRKCAEIRVIVYVRVRARIIVWREMSIYSSALGRFRFPETAGILVVWTRTFVHYTKTGRDTEHEIIVCVQKKDTNLVWLLYDHIQHAPSNNRRYFSTRQYTIFVTNNILLSRSIFFFASFQKKSRYLYKCQR